MTILFKLTIVYIEVSLCLSQDKMLLSAAFHLDFHYLIDLCCMGYPLLKGFVLVLVWWMGGLSTCYYPT